MAIAGTESTLTVDANVVHYYFLFTDGHSFPQGLRVRRIKDFCVSVLDKYPIAINEFIRTEYQQLVGLEPAKNWLAKRLQRDLAIQVDCCPVPGNVKARLRNDYGFDCQSRGAKYIEICLNTIFKHLVTENTEHFDRPHRSRRRRRMPAFLQRELSLCICTIDECCCRLLTD